MRENIIWTISNFGSSFGQSDADPDSYALTGEETLIFLYTNGGEETVAGRVNIDGYISGICSLKSYMTAFEKKENSGSHNSGNSSSSGIKTRNRELILQKLRQQKKFPEQIRNQLMMEKKTHRLTPKQKK